MLDLGTLEHKDIFTLALAAYGAALSTFNLVQSVRKDRRRIFVEISPSFYRYANGELSTQMASIDVVNRGQRPVVVSAPTLRMPNGKYLSFTDAKGFKDFPRKLEDGEKASIDVRYREISDALKRAGYKGKVRLRPSCKDTANKRYRGKKWKLDTDRDWAP